MNGLGEAGVLQLPDGYNPNDDQGRRVVEMFLDWDEPPTNILIDARDGRYFAITRGGRQVIGK